LISAKFLFSSALSSVPALFHTVAPTAVTAIPGIAITAIWPVFELRSVLYVLIGTPGQANLNEFASGTALIE
jgi:hypothetical protein